jgi:hypothetical protein
MARQEIFKLKNKVSILFGFCQHGWQFHSMSVIYRWAVNLTSVPGLCVSTYVLHELCGWDTSNKMPA